jgi:hypothetical protein
MVLFSDRRGSLQLSNAFDVDKIEKMRRDYAKFIFKCRSSDGGFRLTPRAEPSPFARCFGLFGLNILRSDLLSHYCSDQTAQAIRDDLDATRLLRLDKGVDLAFDKPYLQLLCFSLSALHIINKLHVVPLDDHILPLVKRDIVKDLERCGALRGVRSTGNQAMFMAILRVYADQQLGVNCKSDINDWICTHIASMNSIGFWEPRNVVTYSQFQNGYHQYEIFEYLAVEGDFLVRAAKAVSTLCDRDGRFAPLPGGGGCHDYDAASILLAARRYAGIKDFDVMLMRLASVILASQSEDGGFSETKDFRPFNVRRSLKIFSHLMTGPIGALPEKLHQLVSLSRPFYSRIETHWSVYRRGWDESNLWDSWFRIMIYGRIQSALRPELPVHWHPIDFPGIGFFRN